MLPRWAAPRRREAAWDANFDRSSRSQILLVRSQPTTVSEGAGRWELTVGCRSGASLRRARLAEALWALGSETSELTHQQNASASTLRLSVPG